MAIWYWPYELRPRVPLGPKAGTTARRGALLRVGDGFADLHPWPELGDLPIETQLARLAAQQPTPQAQCSLQLAARDRKARESGLSLFGRLRIPPSHYLWTDIDSPLDFSRIREFKVVKMKSGREVAPLYKILGQLRGAGVKARIDFNGSLDEQSAAEFLGKADRGTIDFLEDPMPGGPAWERISLRFQVRLAADRVDEKSAAVLVHKPALRPLNVPPDRSVVVTSYLDHPVGQLHAAAVAAELASREPDRVERCGLLTHVLFEKNEFSERMRAEGPRLLPPEGTGVGFDDLLTRLPWKKLA